jgi:hypothetical protein
MGIQKAVYRVGFAMAILAVAAACSSGGASRIVQHSPGASPTASPSASAKVTVKPTDTPWPTAKATAVPTASPTEAPTDNAADTPAPAPAGWKTYTDSTIGITFAYPSDWAQTTSSGYPAVGSSANKSLVLWMTQAAGGMTLEAYKPIDLASMDVAPDNQGEVSIGGVLGWGADWHVTKSGTPLYVVDCFTVRNDKTYDFMWMSAPGNETADIDLFKQIESTLVFTK